MLPCLNEEESLPAVLAAIPAGYRALVVDNNSTDDTATVAARHGAQVVVEPRPGYGSAVHAGVLAATTPIVAVIDADGLDIDTVQAAVDNAPGARIAIGTTANGVEGFRRSHLEALITQRTLSRLRSTQRVAFFADVKMVALISQNPDAASEFITSTLGDLESASPDLQTALLTFINEQCNASRAAKRLHTHRNTFLRRLESAQRLLPRPLDHTSVHVAVALEALQWRGNKAHALSSPGRRSNSVPA
ncbi:glycosyltransferase [Mycobacterium tuberculosis]|nr:glycosyltransferase [Mycobacterium tuberculosis]